MDSNESSSKGQNTINRVVCTFVFTLFTFFYLYYYQADLLTVMQHVFSKGQTHYNHFIGAVLITCVLLLLQVGVANSLRRLRVAWAITYLPSAFCLAALTDVRLSVDSNSLVFGGMAYVLPVALAVYVLAVWGAYASGLTKTLTDIVGGGLRQLWVNLLVVLCAIVMVAFGGNNDKVYHARIHAEQQLLDGDVEGALETIRNIDRQDANLTMLAAYALSRKQALGERLFEYRPAGGSDALIPDGKTVKFELIPDSTFYLRLNGWYLQKMSTMKYVDYQRRHRRINKYSADYMLCGYLLDRKLDAFVAEIGKYYHVNDSTPLPKHYREALVLYTHLRSTPRVIYKNSVMDADYEDYQNVVDSVADTRRRKNMLRDTFGKTYWYYYQYK